ncbi:uncharacterized protein LOC135482201 [Liolophura sinensis]|uniref:uncharacterized protein LOC135482201 n=1 Tax=Liolophura sinensis TaxID=3198878 RepID=UPI0031592D4A
MVATKGQAISMAVVSILTLGTGIAVMVLFHNLFMALGVRGLATPAISYFWPYGLPVIVVGVLGIIAAAVRNNVAMGIYMGICIVSLVVQAVFVVIFALVLFALEFVQSRTCYLIDGICTCTETVDPAVMTPCEDPYIALAMLTRAASALIIISWILMLSGSIISCTACCCGQRQDTAGMIITHVGTPNYELNKPGGYGGVHGAGDQYKY